MAAEYRHVSPSGEYGIRISSWEARMSLWVDQPTVAVVATGEVVFGFVDSNWSLGDACWLDAKTVEMTVRKYPGGQVLNTQRVRIDCEARTGWVDGGACALWEIEARLEAAMAEAAKPVGRPRGAAFPDGASSWLP